MSLLNAWVSPKRAVISIDTYGRMPDGRICETTKILHLPHLRSVFAFRGDRWLVWDLLSRYHLSAADGDHDDVVAMLPELFAHTLLVMNQSGKPATDYQFAVVGWSERHGRMGGRWYTGNTAEGEFDVAELGARVAPWGQEPARIPDTDENVRWLAERQAAWLRASDEAGGGRLLVASMTRDSYELRDLGSL